jgi:hypothetical protein
VELIKKLMDVSWDMWEHRNAVLHASPERHHKADELEEANAAIEKEWVRGSAGLLTQDLFLFRHRESVDKKTLTKKLEWLEAVSAARWAAEEANRPKPAYEQERNGMRNWLEPTNKRRRTR